MSKLNLKSLPGQDIQAIARYCYIREILSALIGSTLYAPTQADYNFPRPTGKPETDCRAKKWLNKAAPYLSFHDEDKLVITEKLQLGDRHSQLMDTCRFISTFALFTSQWKATLRQAKPTLARKIGSSDCMLHSTTIPSRVEVSSDCP
eukprot:scaffold647964_cov45-Prasinocladus_malaysianus.AAC.1